MNDSLADAVSEAVKPMQVLRGEVRRNIYLTIEWVLSFASQKLVGGADIALAGSLAGDSRVFFRTLQDTLDFVTIVASSLVPRSHCSLRATTSQ